MFEIQVPYICLQPKIPIHVDYASILHILNINYIVRTKKAALTFYISAQEHRWTTMNIDSYPTPKVVAILKTSCAQEPCKIIFKVF
jgi:hypothetical protein